MTDTPSNLAISTVLQDFERRNEPLAALTESLFAGVLAVPLLHAKLLNTLALMEHIGSRKIMVTQGVGALDQDTLKHLAEEARHAFFFKRQAEIEAGRAFAFDGADLIAAPTARGYFQRLEATVKRACAGDAEPATVYLYMSMIVEFRAVWAYKRYQRALVSAGHRMSLKGLLAEEQGHLDGMAARLAAVGSLTKARVDAFIAVETVLFGRLLDRLRRLLDSLARAFGHIRGCGLDRLHSLVRQGGGALHRAFGLRLGHRLRRLFRRLRRLGSRGGCRLLDLLGRFRHGLGSL